MATKEHYDFFKSQYDEENIRNNELTKRAEIYLSIVSLVLTSVFFKIKDIVELFKCNAHFLLTLILVIGLLCFLVSLFFIINSIRIREYEGAIDYDRYMEKNDKTFQSNEEFFKDRILEYIVAIEINEEINNQKADLLVIARKGILFGFLITMVSIIALLLI